MAQQNFTTPVGRLVSGHPMETYPAMDDRTNQQRKFADGTPMESCSFGIAFPKNGTTDWKQTDWGKFINDTAVAAFPRGEWQHKAFSWKVTDGDSTEVNKKMIAPCSREGYPGHWVLFAHSCFTTGCYHVGMYQAHQVIQNKNEIKRGDYVRLNFACTGNNSKDTPGVYINPLLVELSRAGQQIMSANAPDASAAFGASAPVIPQNAMIDDTVQQPTPVAPTAPVTPQVPSVPTPAHDLVAPQVPSAPVVPQLPEMYEFQGTSLTMEQWNAAGWSAEMVHQHCTKKAA